MSSICRGASRSPASRRLNRDVLSQNRTATSRETFASVRLSHSASPSTSISRSRPHPPSKSSDPTISRSLHSEARLRAVAGTLTPPAPTSPAPASPTPKTGIRDRLRFWTYDENLKRKALADRQEHSELLSAKAAVSSQAIPEESDGFDPDELDAYLAELDAITSIDDVESHGSSPYEPGDIVELAGTSSISSRLAIYVRNVGQTMQYYTVDGKVRFSGYQNALFIARGVFDPRELETISAFLPAERNLEIHDAITTYAENVPRETGAPIVKKLVDFQNQFEEAYRQHASVFDNAHTLVAHPTDTINMSLEDIASRLTGKPLSELSEALLLACSNSLLRSKFGFRIALRTYGVTRNIEVESKRSAAAIRRVAHWARAYQEDTALRASEAEIPSLGSRDSAPIKDFASKAKPLIERSRKLRHATPDGAVLTVKRDDPDLLTDPLHSLNSKFSSDDQDIIQFLKLFVSTKSFFYHPAMRAVGPTILRAVGSYEDRQLDAETIHTLLVEIGVIQPFEDVNAIDRELTRDDPSLTTEINRIDTNIKDGHELDTAAGLVDSMSHLRHDFGQLPVFCIDSASTTEVDDGVSFEEIVDHPGHAWMHVHVAHAPAFISPDSTLSKYARNRFTTQYLPDALVKMLPEWVSKRFSLAPGMPSLTVSLRVDDSGVVQETLIRAGVIRNVIRLTRETIDAAFGFSTTEERVLTMDIGDTTQHRPEASQLSELSEAHTQILRRLYDLNLKVHENRVQQSQFTRTVNKRHGELQVLHDSDMPLSLQVDSIPAQARFATQDPAISYKKNRFIDVDLLGLEREVSPSDIIVEDSMLLANRYTAEWAAERGVPLPFAMTATIVGGVELEKELLSHEIAAMARGEIPYHRETVTWFRTLFTTTFLKASPAPHRGLGFPAYVRMTSPLRRFGDFIVHWNVNATILEEARLGRKVVPEDDKSFLPVQRDSVEQYIHYSVWRMREIMRINGARRKHWLIHAFARAHYLGEFKLPSPLIITTAQSGGNRRLARIEDLEISAEVLVEQGEDGNRVSTGDRWEARVDKVLPGTRRIIMTPTRRLVDGSMVRMKRAVAMKQSKQAGDISIRRLPFGGKKAKDAPELMPAQTG